MIIETKDRDDQNIQICIGCGSEPDARPGEPWIVSIYDEGEDNELYITLPREFAQTVIDGLTRYLERTAE